MSIHHLTGEPGFQTGLVQQFFRVERKKINDWFHAMFPHAERESDDNLRFTPLVLLALQVMHKFNEGAVKPELVLRHAPDIHEECKRWLGAWMRPHQCKKSLPGTDLLITKTSGLRWINSGVANPFDIDSVNVLETYGEVEMFMWFGEAPWIWARDAKKHEAHGSYRLEPIDKLASAFAKTAQMRLEHSRSQVPKSTEPSGTSG